MKRPKNFLPLNIETILGIIFSISGFWLFAKLLGIGVPLDGLGFQKIIIWITALGSAYCGIHILVMRFRHQAVKSLL